MINIALVAYLNTRPFMDGFEQFISDQDARFHLYPPADCARALEDGTCQMALIPVGSLPRFKSLSLMSNYCLGANGPVESVYLFSQKPVEELDTILLDPHSNTSNGLVRILLKHYWKKDVECIMPDQKHFDRITGNTGGVIIGDKAIHVRKDYQYAYDLSEEWRNMTGLPFTFAVWAYQPGTIPSFLLTRLNEAMKWGISQIEECAEKWAGAYKLTRGEAFRYLKNCLDYRFDAPKHRAMELYYQLLTSLQEPVKA